MNYSGKFDAKLPADGSGLHSNGHAHVETISKHATHAPSDAIIVPDAQLLFNGDFKRSGVDLVLSKDDHELVLQDYFKGEKRAALSSPDGAHLTGDIVNALAGHVEYAQADGSASVGKVIGHVTKLAGTATAIRNGVSIILNQGDNVEKGDVVQSGSNSTLGLTFIDGTVFGLSSNARMVLNEMVYDPNGSNNSSLLSLVAGTITFVAGETAKHGDMKVDTPVATMGIRGTACLVEIDFLSATTLLPPIPPTLPPSDPSLPPLGATPPPLLPTANFQVLVEPDGTTGSYILFDKLTLLPLITVDKAGQMVSINNGNVSVGNALLSPDVQKLITDVFTMKFTSTDSTTKLAGLTTDTLTPQALAPFILANGAMAIPLILNVETAEKGTAAPNSSGPGNPNPHIDQKPQAVASSNAFAERADTTGSSALDKVSGQVNFTDINAGDRPTVSTQFDSFTYQNAAHQNVTLNPQQLADILAVEAKLLVTQDPDNNNNGSATWTFSVPDGAFDFLGAGETLVLHYLALVDNNYAPNDAVTSVPFDITITGTNDAPTITATSAALAEHSGIVDHAGGTITFQDVDLTDRPVVSTAFSSFTYRDSHGNDKTLTAGQQAAVEASLTLTPSLSNANNGAVTWSYDVSDSQLGFLADGDTLTLTYLASVDDGHGGVTHTPITVTILGVSDAPHLITELPGHTGDTADFDTASGALTFTGVDLSNINSVDHSVVSATWSGGSVLPSGLASTLESSFTTSLASSVGFTFSAPDSTFDFLADGETLALIYEVTVADNHGDSSSRLVTIIITGTEDAPTIVAGSTTPTGGVTEDTDVVVGNIGTSGTVGFQDLDLTDTHTASFVPTSSTSSAHLPGYVDNTTYIGTFALAAVSENNTDTINTASLGWTFTLNDSDPVLQSLALGQTITQVYTVTITDNNGAPVSQDVTVTITGTNDAPVITSAAASVGVTEDTNIVAGNIGTSGTIAFQDVDLIDTHTAGFVLKSTNATADLPGFAEAIGSGAANIGTFALAAVSENNTDTINTASLGWTFTLNDSDPVLQSLALGQTITQVYTVTITDNNGAPVSQDVTVTITGTNDAPVITSAAASVGVTEDTDVVAGNIGTSGTIAFQDVDLIDTHTAGFVLKSTNATADLPGFAEAIGSGAANIGTFALAAVSENNTDTINTASLGWTFTLNDSNPVLQSLALGQTITQVYTVTITDNNGAPVSQDVTVTITGTNDAPVITSAAASVGVTEDTNIVAGNIGTSGTIAFQDVDLIDTHTAGFVLKSTNATADLPGFAEAIGSGAANIGTFALTASTVDPLTHLVSESSDTINTASLGWTFTLNDSNPVLQSLALGQTITQVYTVTITDNNGAPVSQDVTVTITGTNDAPVITSAAASVGVTEDTNIVAGNIGTSGTIAFQDVDLIDTHTAGFVLKSTNATADLPGFAEAIGSGAANIGTFALTAVSENNTDTINTASLGWSFTLNDSNPVLQSLALGQTITQVYTVTITDNNGAPVSQDVTVTITGTNDAPVITSAAASVGVTEDTNIVAGNIGTSGTIAFQDVDLIDTHTAGFVLKSTNATADLPGFAEAVGSGAANIGTFALAAVSENNTDTTNTASLGWTFTLNDSNPVLQSLALGQTITQVYTVTITDNNGAPVSQDVTVTITGTNDAPVITSAAASVGVTEDTNIVAGNIGTSGTIAFQDVDLIDTHTAGFVLKSTNATADLPGFAEAVGSGAANIGTFALTAVSENNTDTINTASLGWSFTLNDSNPVLQSLALGQTITQVYTVTITDNNGAPVSQDVTVTITGTNDAPVITSAAASVGVTEDTDVVAGNIGTSGTIAFQDVDLIDTHTAGFVLKSTNATADLPGFAEAVGSGAANIGTFALAAVSEDNTDTTNTASLGWTFTLNDSNPVLQSLALGQTITQVYTVTITDNNGAPVSQDVTVTITGTNDAPVITSAAASVGVTEDTNIVAGNIGTSGTIAFQDVDLIDTHTAGFVLKSTNATADLPGFAEAVGSGAANIGTFALAAVSENNTDTTNTASLGWTFTLNDSNPVLQSLALGQTITQVYTVTVSDNHGGTVPQDVTVTITGINDAPAIVTGSTTATGAIGEIAATTGSTTLDSANGSIAFTDVDLIDSHTVSQAAPTFVWSGGTLSAGQIAALTSASTLALTKTDSTGTGAGSVAWNYSAQDKTFDFLAAGQTLKVTYAVTVADGHTGSASQNVVVTVTGANDAPTGVAFTVDANAANPDPDDDNDPSGSHVDEHAIIGQFAAVDPDTGDTFTYSLGSGSSSNFSLSSSGVLSTGNNDVGSGTYTVNVIATDNHGAAQATATPTTIWVGTVGNNTISLSSITNTIIAYGLDGNDTITTGSGNDALIGGHGADTMTGGGGSDTFDFFAGDSALTIGGTGTSGTISGYDTITDYTPGATAPASEKISFVGVSVSSATSSSVISTLKLHTGFAVTSDNVSNGIVTFNDTNGTNSVSLTSLADVAAAVQFLQAYDIGTTGSSLAFSATISGVTHTFVFIQGSSTGATNNNDVLIDLQGVSATSLSTSGLSNQLAVIGALAPAGIAGEPINLALTDLSGGQSGPITATVTGIPSGWTLTEGTDNGDGSWTVQTDNIAALSITSLDSYSGALVLNVAETWTNADGTAGNAIVADNVEAYAKGSPIFARSGDDTLTASSGNDLIVFANPIGNDTIHNFDVTADKIDLIGFDGISGFNDVQSHLTSNSNGDAVIAISNGVSITLQGVSIASLTTDDFVFDQTPVTNNAGTMTIGDGAMLPLSGTINNAGTIALNSTGDETDLQLIQSGATLHGGGKIVLSDSDANIISGTSSSVTLNNEDNTISGAGQLGNGELTLINAGTINATGTHVLNIDTGSNIVSNSGTLEASGSGVLTIESAIANSGILWANGANLTVQGAVSGNGTANIDGAGTLDFEASSTANVVFGSGAAGTLKLGDAFHFNGTISGFAGSDSIDLANLGSSATESISYHENAAGTGGTLTISDGVQTVELALLGQYSADNFSIVPDHAKGTLVTFVPHDLMV